MLGSLNSGITGMDAAAMAMDVIGNNIANVNTCAFKAGTVSFASVFAESVSILGGKSGNEEGKGVKVVGLNSVWEQGAVESTMNQTDLAITGEGFFKVEELAGTVTAEYFTRAGQFRYDENGFLTDPEGRRVKGFAITDPTDFSTTDVSANVDLQLDYTTHTEAQLEGNGFITAINSTTGNRDYLYQVAVFNFVNNDGLRKVNGNLYEESDDSGPAVNSVGTELGNRPGEDGAGMVGNNHLEMSNVDLSREFVDLIVTQRAFQANSRVISSSADMLQEVINIIR